jgi:hypothetical protein
VQTCGETPETISATTDAAGRFTLNNLPNGKLFVTASKKDYRMTYLAVDTRKDAELQLTLRKLSEAPAAPPEISAAFLAERKQATIDMFEIVWKKRGESGYGNNFFSSAQRLDPALAQKWANSATGAEAARLKRLLESKVSDEKLVEAAMADTEEAIEQLTAQGSSSYYRLIAVGELLLARDKAKALRFAEVSVEQGRKENAKNPARLANALASSAVLAHRAGNVAGAKTLFAEAIELLGKVVDTNSGLLDAARGWVAGSLGQVDLPGAVKLLATIEKSYYHNAAVTKICLAQAKTDPKAAVESLKYIKPDRSSSHLLHNIEVAMAVVDRDPDAALRLIEAVEKPVDSVQGYMEMASCFATKDRPKAWGYIDTAFQILDRQSDAFATYGSSGGVAAAAGQLIHVARKIHYPDVHSLLARALELRGTRGLFSRDDDDKVRLALSLSSSDPASARWLLQGLYSPEKLRKISTSGKREYLFALAMCDPQECVKAVDEATGQTLNASTISRTGIVEMLDAMSHIGQEIEALSEWQTLMYRPINRVR